MSAPLSLKLKGGPSFRISQKPAVLPLFTFARYENINEKLQSLAELAMREDWDNKAAPGLWKNPILYNYIQHTFARIQDEGKIEHSRNAQFCTFNTGLVTSNYEAIFELFMRNKNPNGRPWYFIAHVKESDRSLTKFANLPEQADYFKEPKELIFDTRLSLRKNVDHIIDDNLPRFPDYVQKMDSYARHILVEGAISHAIKRTRRNYKTAIPQFYGGNLQLLLPLCFSAQNQADLALVVERCAEYYRASTILTLDMASNNARLIVRPDADWLRT